MTIDIKFDPNQPYQRDAIDSVVDLFEGQEAAEQGMTTADLTADGVLFDEVVFGNTLTLHPVTIRENLRRIQDRETQRDDGSTAVAIGEDLRAPWLIGEDDQGGWVENLDFSLEMETGTGKTYVYLRTIAELNQKYGYTKFVVVVPSVAIREGVTTSLKLLKEHIGDVYGGLQYDAFVWDPRSPTLVRQFATASHLQILVVNIDSFTGDKKIMTKALPDQLNGYAPIEYLRACRPIVVMDEPQNMETPIRQAAIASLAPLFKLRYSATHKDLKHLVYRLTPVDAYDMRLVKRIGVLSVVQDDDHNQPYVEVMKVNATRTTVTATAKIHKATKLGTRLTQVTLRKDDDLYELSGNRSVYQGWTVEDIHAPRAKVAGLVEFANGQQVTEAEGLIANEQQQRQMMTEAVKSHFEKELQLTVNKRRGVIPAAIKPLTLFFIDRVANYAPHDAKFRIWFEEAYEQVRADGKYRALRMPQVAEVHNGYFATTTKGEPKDLQFGRDTNDADAAYQLIMRDKERLLSFETPLRFIFSHSALVEGWDNPNVFTICNLQDGKSVMRKRQQIGRGLRLPVMENGERCWVNDVNMLTVIAHEGFSSFADALQREIKEDTGIDFPGGPVDPRKPTTIQVRPEVLDEPTFKDLWARISHKTHYRMDFQTDDVVTEAVRRINVMEPLEPVRFRITKATVDIDSRGVGGADPRSRGVVDVAGAQRLPDVVGELSRRVPLSRATIVRILTEIEKDTLDLVWVNPAVFIDRVAAAMNQALYDQVADGIAYTPVGERWEAQRFIESHQETTLVPEAMVVATSKSITDKVVCDSQVEVEFATALQAREDIKLFLKLPGWFLVPTPLGNYNPDWALVRQSQDGEYLYLVRETKGTDRIEELRWESEGWKIKFGEAHFDALNVDFSFGHDVQILLEPTTVHGRSDSERDVL